MKVLYLMAKLLHRVAPGDARHDEARLYCHGQGYDMVERPLVRGDEPMTSNWLCDNYLIGDNGPGERLHKFPEEIVEVGQVAPIRPAIFIGLTGFAGRVRFSPTKGELS